jgi:16S rRNA (guanine527-N7)-methyltransferase
VEQGQPEPALEDRLRLLAHRIATSPHNLVSRGDRQDVLGRHVRECVALGGALGIRSGHEWVDVGTGGGLPGLVLALVRPNSRWVLIDATRKKIEEVRSFAVELGLDNVEAVAGRAETLAHDPGFRERFDGAATRALGPLPVVMELCRGFVKPGGTIAAVRGSEQPGEMESARLAAQALRAGTIHSREVPSSARATRVVTMRADGPAPSHFPRRDGIPRSKPLGGPAPSA